MAVWCTGEGVATVLVKEHISIDKVFHQVFKGCDKKLTITTQTTDAYHQHTLKFSIDLSAEDFIPKWKEFVKLCKFSSCDIDINLRWYM